MVGQISPLYDYLVFIDEGNSWGLFSQLVSPGSRSICVRANGNLTFNYLDVNRLPLSPDTLSDSVAMARVLIGASTDEDTNNLREAHLTNSVRQLYNDYYQSWQAKNGERLFTIAREAFAIHRHWRSRMHEESSFADAVLDWREFCTASADESQSLLAKADDGEVLRFMKAGDTEELTKNLLFSKLDPSEMPRHSQLQELLLMESFGNGSEAEEKRILARLLEPWNTGGAYGPLVDGVSNVDFSGKSIHVELGQISESAAKLRGVAGFLVTNRIRSEIMNRPRKQRKGVILEELSAFLNIPQGDKVATEFFERLGKYNAWIFAILQNIARIKTPATERVLNSIMGNTKLMFILRQEERTDIEKIAAHKPIPEATKESIFYFPDPTKSRDNPFSSFVYSNAGDGRPTIAIGRHYANDEALYVASSAGAMFDDRKKELATEPSLIDGVIKHAHLHRLSSATTTKVPTTTKAQLVTASA